MKTKLKENATQCNRNHLYTFKLHILRVRCKFNDQMHNFSYEIGENYVELRSSIKIGNSLTSGLKSFKDLKNSIINNYMSFRLPIIYSMLEISREVENCLGLQAQLSFYEDDNNQITFLTCFKYIVLRFCIFCIFFIVVYIDF